MADIQPVLTLSVNTFIRYYSLDHSKLVGEVSRRMQQSGGYDYYRILGEAIRAHIRKSTEDEIQVILNNSNNPSEISHNKAAYKVFLAKYGSKKGLETFDKKAKLKLCGGELVITASPTFAINHKDEYSTFNIWGTQFPEIDRTKASVGVYLCQQAFKKTLPNYTYKFFDAVAGKTYSAVNNTTALAVEGVARRIIELAKM